MKINEIIEEAAMPSAASSFLSGLGLTQSANALNAYSNTNNVNGELVRAKTAPTSAARPAADTDTDTNTNINWDPNKSILTIDGLQYQKTKKGWMDWVTKDIIDPKHSAELQTAFDTVTGRVAQPVNKTAVKPITVKTNSGKIITKNDSTGKWTTSDGREVNPVDVPELERRAKSQYATRQMK